MAKNKSTSFDEALDAAVASKPVASKVVQDVMVFSQREGTVKLPDGRELAFNKTMQVSPDVAELLGRISGGKIRVL